MDIDRTVYTLIDSEKCIGCGLCIDVCPCGTISMQGDKAIVTGNQSLSCGHCAAVCPVDAITITSLDESLASFQTFKGDRNWLPHGDYDTAQLVRLMGSRRSCRNYTDRPVDRGILEDLVKIGITAPSATNSQLWTFTILPSRPSLLALGQQMVAFFKKLNRMAENYTLRTFLKMIGRKELDAYWRGYYESVKESLWEWENGGIDRLFHGAVAAIVIGSKPGASCPKEDALLAAQNILLAAHSMGLGSCLIGFAVEAMRNDADIKRSLGIPAKEKIHAVIALGYPDEKYRLVTGRKPFVQRYFEQQE